jgi:hypothetical protein
VISSILGPAPVIDFDGTLARLCVPWGDVRDTVDVDRIDDLWERRDQQAWGVVRAAEVDAAAAAEPVPATVDALRGVVSFAVLTSNSEAAVRRFLTRFPSLEARAGLVVGRDQLGGPKTTFDVFARGFASCRRRTAAARGDGPLVYLGDRDFELRFARRLGAVATHVAELAPDSSGLSRPR